MRKTFFAKLISNFLLSKCEEPYTVPSKGFFKLPYILYLRAKISVHLFEYVPNLYEKFEFKVAILNLTSQST